MEMRVKFFCAKHCLNAIEADLCMFIKRVLIGVCESSVVISPSGGQKMGVFPPFSLLILHIVFQWTNLERLYDQPCQLSCRNMAFILRIFCGCLQDKKHCVMMYSSLRE